MKTMFARLGPLDGGSDGMLCAVAAGGLAGKGCSTAGAGALRCPYLGFLALQAATSCGSTSGKSLLAMGRWAVPCMMGSMQSTSRPAPRRAAPSAKPASRQAAVI